MASETSCVALASASAERSRASASRKAASLPAFGFQHDGQLLALGAQDGGLPQAFRFQDLRALLALGLHLPRHAVDEVARRIDVLDLDARHLDAPGFGRLVENLQQLALI